MVVINLSAEVGSGGRDQYAQIDIVAVHGLYEGLRDTWTDAGTSTLWLRDILPQKLPQCRILSYGYEPSQLLSAKGTSGESILSSAQTLIAELRAERVSNHEKQRPIIFICHGFGGLLVKRALVSSSQAVGINVYDQRSIYVSTAAILFLATPHKGVEDEVSHIPLKVRKSTSFFVRLGRGSEIIDEITEKFSPISKRFSICYFWEKLPTANGPTKGFIVKRDSAAPEWDDVLSCGIDADHSRMCKYSSDHEPGLKVILVELQRCIDGCVALIDDRRRTDLESLAKLWEQEEDENRLKVASIRGRSSSRPHSRSSCHQITLNEHLVVPKPASTIFTGRTKLMEEVSSKLLPSSEDSTQHQHKIYVLHGLGGSGKTAFCLKFVQENYKKYWGVFWIDASSDANAQESFAKLGQLAKKVATFDAGKHWLASTSMPWLLIIDNVDDRDMDLSKYFPAGGGGSIIVTTRNPNNTMYSTVGWSPIAGMDEDDGVTLLLKSAYSPVADMSQDQKKRDLARPIVDALGGLALALIHVGTTIKKHIYTLENCLAGYLRDRRDIIRRKDVQSLDDYKLTIITTWEIPFRRIEERSGTDHMDAIELLHVFAFLHFQQVPRELFERAWRGLQSALFKERKQGILHWLTTITKKTETPTSPRLLYGNHTCWDERRLGEAFAVLSDFSLIDYHEGTNTYSMHPVVHAWARDRLPQNHQRLWLWIATATLAYAIPGNVELSDKSFLRRVVPHIESCLKEWKSQLLSFPKTAEEAKNAFKFANAFRELGIWTQALAEHLRIATFRAERLGSEHSDTIESKKALGQLYWDLFDPREALKLQNEVYDTEKRALGAESYSVYVALNELSKTYWLAGDLEKSESFAERATEHLTRLLGPDDPMTLGALHNLGRACLHLSQYERSREILTDVYRKRVGFFGERHTDTLATKDELGMSLLALGELKMAEDLVYDVLECRRESLGKEHAYTLWSENNYAKIISKQGRNAEAIKILKLTVSVAVRTLGASHVGVRMTIFNLAYAYVESGQFHEAEKLLRPQLSNVERLHPDWVTLMFEVAKLSQLSGKITQAQEEYEEILDVIGETQILSWDHDLTQKVSSALLLIYDGSGQAKAGQALREVMSTKSVLLEKDS